MELTIDQILSADRAITGVKDTKFPVKVSYRLSRLQQIIKPITTQFQENNRKLIVEEYGVQKEDSTEFSVPKEKLEEYYKAVNTLLAEKENIELKPLNLSDFTNIEISPEFLSNLGPFVIED